VRKKTLYLLFMPLLLFLFLFPKESFKASCDGVVLWSNTVLPSLLPFIILSNLLIQTNLMAPLLDRIGPICRRLLGTSSYGAYVWILGLLCGFPMGAKLTSDLYSSGHLDRSEANYLLMISNHASPSFIITFIVTQTLGNEALMGPVLWILYGSAVLSMLIVRFICQGRHRESGFLHKKEVSMTGSSGAILDTSIMNGFEIITRLGGYIILFSIYGALLRKLLRPFPLLLTVISGLIEITTGITCIRNSTVPAGLQFFLILCCTSFGGLSTMAQTNCVIQESGLSIRTYLYGKLVNTTVTALLVTLFLFIL